MPGASWEIIIIIIIIFVINCMQGIDHYIPETNHVFRVHSVKIILYMQFVLHVMLFPLLNILYFQIRTSFSMCAVLNRAVFCIIISCFPGMLLR
jgi:hypothetical protein